MAVIYEFTPEQRAEWEAWLAEPGNATVRSVAERFPPNRLFRMRETGHRGQPLSYSEDGTLTLAVDGRFNRILFSRKVFGIHPDDLTECELPAPGEDVGDTAADAGYTEKEIRTILIPRIMAERASGGRPAIT